MNSASASTIYALASAAGRAGVAVFRLSGPQARQALAFLGVKKSLEPRLATLTELCAPDGTTIDQALALFFPAPHSFTGEDVVELHTHGSRAVTKLLMDTLAACPGLRMAEAGEFARRAFLAGKMDLAQAEGLADLIDAETKAQHAQAIRQLGGDSSARLDALRMAILEPLALLEAYIDFPDEEIPDTVLKQTTLRVEALTKQLQELLNDHHIGEKIRDGLEIVILGAPNAGKSSLLNLLARRDAAIVSPEAGTTRDLIEVQMDINGYAVTLVDTAGLRDTENAIEAEGIRRTRARAERADLTLHLIDSSDDSLPLRGRVGVGADYPETSPQRAPHPTSPRMGEEETTLTLYTKSDLNPALTLPDGALAISTKTGAGIDQFLTTLTDHIAAKMEHHTSPLITRARHREALIEAATHLARFPKTVSLELQCEELRRAATAIGKITGKIAVDDILDLVFSRFCIGK